MTGWTLRDLLIIIGLDQCSPGHSVTECLLLVYRSSSILWISFDMCDNAIREVSVHCYQSGRDVDRLKCLSPVLKGVIILSVKYLSRVLIRVIIRGVMIW